MEKLNELGIKWLNTEFGNLTKVVKDNIVFYVDDGHKPLIMYIQGEKNEDIYINYDRIWSFFKDVFAFKHQQIQGVLKTWLEETYNLKGYTPTLRRFGRIGSWKTPII